MTGSMAKFSHCHSVAMAPHLLSRFRQLQAHSAETSTSAERRRRNFSIPDNFAFIPIETLSLVYEQFLHTDDPNKKKEAKNKKTKGRQEGAYYTPLPLVNFMLAGLERHRPLERGMKVFDPSSGSGSFLVQAYRLLIEKTFPVTQPKPKPSDLKVLLRESIFGCDVDGDACQVTQLELAAHPPGLCRSAGPDLADAHLQASDAL